MRQRRQLEESLTLLHQYPTTEPVGLLTLSDRTLAVRRGSDSATSISYYRAVGLLILSYRDGS